MQTAIIIVSYKTPWHLDICLQSVFQYTKDFHLILVQNGNDSESIEVIKKFQNLYPEQITLIKNETNLGFVGGVNSAYSKAMEFERVCLLNSDTIVTEHWLDELNKALDENPNAVQVSPDSNSFYSDQIFWKIIKRLPMGLSKLVKHQVNLNSPKAKERSGFTKVSNFWFFPGGFCNLFKTKYFKDLGYFNDPNIIHGYWDDFDLAYYLSQFGEVGSTNKSYVYHFINVSFNKISEDKKGMKDRLMLLNGLYVMDKWRERLKKDLTQLNNEQLLEAENSYVVKMALEYFGLVEAKPEFAEYIRSIPARAIGKTFLK